MVHGYTQFVAVIRTYSTGCRLLGCTLEYTDPQKESQTKPDRDKYLLNQPAHALYCPFLETKEKLHKPNPKGVFKDSITYFQMITGAAYFRAIVLITANFITVHNGQVQQEKNAECGMFEEGLTQQYYVLQFYKASPDVLQICNILS